MGVGIVTIGVVDRNVGAHSFIHELLSDKLLQKLDLLLARQLDGQRGDKFPRQTAVLGFLRFLHGVPEFFPVLPFRGGPCPAETPPARQGPVYGVSVEQQKRDTIDENGIPAL